MRYIAIFLIFVNVAYFGWSTFSPGPVLSVPRQSSGSLLNRGLTLVSEFEERSAQLAQALADSTRGCLAVGEFSTVDDARLFMLSIPQQFDSKLSLTGELLPSSYRVYIPPSTSREIASITLDGLSERLREDESAIETYLITRGLLQNAVALGIYESLEQASEVRAQVEEFGYSVEIEPIPRSEGGIEVELWPTQIDPNSQVDWPEFPSSFEGLTATEKLCQTIAQDNQFP